MPISPKLPYYILFLSCLLSIDEISAQRSKKIKTTDEIGLLVGLNMVLFYPNDVNKNPINGGAPQLFPKGMMALSYYHSFNRRLAHVFQVRMSDHQIKYWKTSDQNWHLNGERVTVKADSGDYVIKYRELSTNYLIGWCLNKKIGWHVYGGLQWNFTVNNHSTKNVDRVEYGKLIGFEYFPYQQPLYFENEVSKTYSPDANGEILIRSDVKIKANDKWSIRPAVEFGFDPGHVYVSIKERVAFYIEIYRHL